MLELTIFAAGIGIGYLVAYLPYRDIKEERDQLLGSLYARIGYKPEVVRYEKTPPEASAPTQRTTESYPDLLAIQEQARNED